MKLKQTQIKKFQTEILLYYKTHGRDFAWRKNITPYTIFISEVMLQQTQVKRVEVKFKEFIQKFPGFQTLASANLSEIYPVWQGMGYNRRAKYLQEAAKIIVEKYRGKPPHDLKELDTLPGIGAGTAGSICAFAFNKPTVFIETNIRSVFIHFFFRNKNDVHDTEIMPLIEQTLERKNPRIWYWALMDYGTHLKNIGENPSRKSIHHSKQKKFEGSNRQLRGHILKIISEHKKMTSQNLVNQAGKDEETVQKTVRTLIKEGLLTKNKTLIRFA